MVIFKTTQNLPVRSGFPPWAANTPIWPLTLALSIAAVSLVLSTLVLIGYWKGGHRRAEKLSIYWTVFAIGAFIVAIVMWAVSAGVLNGAKAAGEGKDLWGWSCKQNTRSAYFEEDINYKLVCRELVSRFLSRFIILKTEC